MGVVREWFRRGRTALVGSVLGLAACANVLDLDDFERAPGTAPVTTTVGGGGGAGGAAGGSPPATTTGIGGAGGSAETCSTWSSWEPASAHHDTGINSFAADPCIGAAHDGQLQVIALGRRTDGLQVGLFKFTLPGVVLDHPATTELRLTLHRRVDACDQPNCFADGVLEIHQLTNAWDEGAAGAVGPSGATWCRRTGGVPPPEWEEPGAIGPTELGAVLGTSDFDDAVASVTVALDPAALDGNPASNFVSLRVNAATDGAFLAVHSKESDDDARRPQLEYRTCIE